MTTIVEAVVVIEMSREKPTRKLEGRNEWIYHMWS